jgi:hypothetical protein
MAKETSSTAGADSISVIFDGALAAAGQLHFYEYGRAAYGFARLISTIENFRRTGRVAKKVSAGSYINIIIKAPERGSFPIEVLIPIATQIVPHLQNIPPSILFKYVIHLVTRLLPKEEKAIIELSKIDLQRERQRTKQSQEETKRLAELAKMIETQNVTTRSAIQVLDKALEARDTRISDVDSSPAEIRRLRSKLQTYESRERDFERYQGELESVDRDRLAQLTSRVRPQLGELALPLRRSANRMILAEGATRREFADLDKETVDDISRRSLDEESSIAKMRVKAYDRDTGLGRCDLIDYDLQRVSFSIPVEVRARLRRLILRAMNEDAVSARIRLFRDRSNRITSIIIYDINLLED